MAVAEALVVSVGDVLPLGVNVADALCDCVVLGVEDADGEPDWDAVSVALGGALLVRVIDCVWLELCVREGVAEFEGLCVPVGDGVRVAEELCDPDGVSVALRVWDCV